MDAAYMAAAAAFSPHLGWPLTVFATPDGRPFYAGTYFPPEPRSGLPSFRQVLGAVHEAWTDAPRAGRRHGGCRRRGARRGAGGRHPSTRALPTADDLARAAAALAAREDREFGGFGGGDPAAPKFPVATALRFLQTRAVRDRGPPRHPRSPTARSRRWPARRCATPSRADSSATRRAATGPCRTTSGC